VRHELVVCLLEVKAEHRVCKHVVKCCP
jgi:hypothetical protein